jgi:hypothetical protein
MDSRANIRVNASLSAAAANNDLDNHPFDDAIRDGGCPHHHSLGSTSPDLDLGFGRSRTIAELTSSPPKNQRVRDGR